MPKTKQEQKSTRKVKNAKGTLSRLFKYVFGQHKLTFAFVAVCLVLSSAANSVFSIFLKSLIDDYILPMLSGQDLFSALTSALIKLGSFMFIGVLAGYICSRTMAILSQGVLRDIRDDMFRHMQTLPIKYFDSRTHGDIMSLYTNDTDTLRQMISQSIPELCRSLISIVIVLSSMIIMSHMLTVIAILCNLLKIYVSGKIAGQSRKFFIERQRSLGDVNGYIEEMINGQKVVQVFCHEEKAKEKFDEKNENLFSAASTADKLANMMMPVIANIGQITYVFMAILGGALAINGAFGLTLGTIVSFLQLTRNLNMPINQLSMQANAVIMALAGAERIFELMDEESESDNGYVTLVNATRDENGNLVETDEKHTGIWAWKHPHGDGTLTYEEVRGDVRFFDVDFGYDPDKIVLHNISLFAKPGQKLAFVGHTGAGKTTITNLINRFYDIADGKIRYDGININKIKKSDLRRSLGIVLQDVNLFTGTVMDNIRYGKLDATDEECIAAAKLANAHNFIMMLPNGYQTVLEGDGSGLSQGQRQLISIARAAVADPPVMILDEATSSIDTRTEAIVQRGMDQLMHGRTVFVIAHRLSTVRNSDAIIVLDHGNIIERGNHEDLIAQHGKYYQLYTGALELE